MVVWDWDTLNVCDKRFNSLVQPFLGQTIVLAGEGFRDKAGIPENMKICKRGDRNARMCVETAFSFLTRVCGLRKMLHRLAGYIQAHLAFVTAMFNVHLGLFHALHPHSEPHRMSIAEFAL